MEMKSACVMEQRHIKQEVTASSSVSSSTSSVTSDSESTSFYVPGQPDARQCAVQSRSDGENCPAANGCSEKLAPTRDLDVGPCPPLAFAADLTSSRSCSLSSRWSHYDSPPPPPPPPLNLFYLPFHPSYSNALPPLVSVPPEHPTGILPMQNLLAHYAMTSAAHLPPLLRSLFLSNPAAMFALMNTRPQLTTKLQSASDDGPAGDAAGPTGRRVSCDSTATCGGPDGRTTSSDITSSPRVVSSTSDDFDYDDSDEHDEHAPARLSDVTGSSLSPCVVVTDNLAKCRSIRVMIGYTMKTPLIINVNCMPESNFVTTLSQVYTL